MSVLDLIWTLRVWPVWTVWDRSLADNQQLGTLTRREQWITPTLDTPRPVATVRFIEILDPVANQIYTLDLRGKKAIQTKGYTSPGGFGVPLGGIIGDIPPVGGGPIIKPVLTNKWLGTREVNGIEADGNLRTTVYPVGYQGEAQEITFTEETWYSYRIKSLVRRVTSHPKHGDYEFDLKDIRLGEPDPALFRVPSDYELVEK